jgi:hypothetical protein
MKLAWELANPEKKKAIDKRAGTKWASNNRDKRNAQLARYRAAKATATPQWANQAYINLIYKLAKIESERTNKTVHVDHIVPLASEIVCGLHCEDNLQLLFGSENQSKCNKQWPDMP